MPHTNEVPRIPLNEREALGVAEAAAFLGLSRSVIYAEMKTGALKGFRVGGRRLFRRADLVAFLNRAAEANAA